MSVHEFRLATEHLKPALFKSASWPLAKQMALLKLRHSDVSRAVMERLAHATTRAGIAEYEALVREGYAYRTLIRGQMRLILYPTAHFEANALALAWAKELGLHILISSADKRRQNHSIASDACTCGTTFTYRRGFNATRSNGPGFGAHLDDVKAGRWKPFDADAFMAKVEAQFAETARRRASG